MEIFTESKQKLILFLACLSLGLSLHYYKNISTGNVFDVHSPKMRFYTQFFSAEELLRKNYSIISASVPDFMNDTNFIFDGKFHYSPTAWSYLFQLPLTAASWYRIGFKTVAILTVNFDTIQPNASRLMQHVEKALKKLNVTIVYFNVPSYMKIRLGQVLRLAAGEFGLFNDGDYLITSDADLWPIDRRRYVIKAGKKIFITNAMCCGRFLYNNKRYREYPVSHIGLTTKLWKTIFGGQLVRNKANLSYEYADIQPFMQKLERFTNNSAQFFSPARHGDKLWSLDQRYASVLINDYIDNVDNTTAQLEGGLGLCPRLDTYRINQVLNKKPKCLADAHVFKDHPWKNHRWSDLKRVTGLLFDSKTLKFLEGYRTLFKLMYEEQ